MHPKNINGYLRSLYGQRYAGDVFGFLKSTNGLHTYSRVAEQFLQLVNHIDPRMGWSIYSLFVWAIN